MKNKVEMISALTALSVSLVIFSSGCATKPPPVLHPEEVPTLDANQLPFLYFKYLNPHQVDVSVTDTRKANAEAGNTVQVEQVVKKALLNAVERGGNKIVATSPHKLSLVIHDCEVQTDENMACVAMTLSLKNAHLSAESEAQNRNGFERRPDGTSPGVGDVSVSYQNSLRMVIDGLSKQVEKILVK